MVRRTIGCGVPLDLGELPTPSIERRTTGGRGSIDGEFWGEMLALLEGGGALWWVSRPETEPNVVGGCERVRQRV